MALAAVPLRLWQYLLLRGATQCASKGAKQSPKGTSQTLSLSLVIAFPLEIQTQQLTPLSAIIVSVWPIRRAALWDCIHVATAQEPALVALPDPPVGVARQVPERRAPVRERGLCAREPLAAANAVEPYAAPTSVGQGGLCRWVADHWYEKGFCRAIGLGSTGVDEKRETHVALIWCDGGQVARETRP